MTMCEHLLPSQGAGQASISGEPSMSPLVRLDHIRQIVVHLHPVVEHTQVQTHETLRVLVRGGARAVPVKQQSHLLLSSRGGCSADVSRWGEEEEE